MYWVNEDQISFMICKHGYFNQKERNNEFMDKD